MGFHYTHLAHLLTGAQSRELDRLAIEQTGFDGFTLMETAGKGAADELIRYLERQYQDTRDLEKKILVDSPHPPSAMLQETFQKVNVLCLCGKGNNAGDALVMARYLTLSGRFHVDVFMATGSESLTNDTSRNLGLFLQFSPQSKIYETLDEALISRSTESPNYTILIDGLLGSGVRAPLGEPFTSAIHSINAWKTKHRSVLVVSMDLPSGLHADTGESTGVILEADLTCCFGPKKTGHILNEGPRFSGHVIPITLSFPLHKHSGTLRRIHPSDRSGFAGATVPISRRSDRTLHKYDQGVVYVIGGSPGLTGAPLMASRAAWKKGAGAVFLATPDALLSSFEDQAPELIKITTGTGHSEFQTEDAVALAGRIQDRPGVILLGPGLGKTAARNGFLEQIITLTKDFPLVLDADALRGWNLDSLLKWRTPEQRGPIILTPHPGEAKELFDGIEPGPHAWKLWGVAADNPTIKRLQIAAEVSAHYGVTICSKGDPTAVCAPEYQAITDYPTQGFHRAGFGDILSGQIAANLSFGIDPGHAVIDALLYGYEKWLMKSYGHATPIRSHATSAVGYVVPVSNQSSPVIHHETPVSPEDIL